MYFKPGEPTPKPGSYVTLLNRTDKRSIKGRFLRREGLDHGVVMPDERIDITEDWIIIPCET